MKSGYKNNLHSYTLAQKEIKKVSFIITSERIKYLRINLTKKVKDIYNENYKVLLKQIKEDTTK
jgi:hypothetical protein